MTRTAQETRARRNSCPGPLPTLLPFAALKTCESALTIAKRVRRAARRSEILLLDLGAPLLDLTGKALINIKLASLLALRPSIITTIHFAGFSHSLLAANHSLRPLRPHQLRAARLLAMCVLFVQSLHSSSTP